MDKPDVTFGSLTEAVTLKEMDEKCEMFLEVDQDLRMRAFCVERILLDSSFIYLFSAKRLRSRC